MWQNTDNDIIMQSGRKLNLQMAYFGLFVTCKGGNLTDAELFQNVKFACLTCYQWTTVNIPVFFFRFQGKSL